MCKFYHSRIEFLQIPQLLALVIFESCQKKSERTERNFEAQNSNLEVFSSLLDEDLLTGLRAGAIINFSSNCVTFSLKVSFSIQGTFINGIS